MPLPETRTRRLLQPHKLSCALEGLSMRTRIDLDGYRTFPRGKADTRSAQKAQTADPATNSARRSAAAGARPKCRNAETTAGAVIDPDVASIVATPLALPACAFVT